MAKAQLFTVSCF